MNGTMTKITAKTAAEVCKKFALADEAKASLLEGMTPKEFVEALLKKKQYPPTILFLSHALPKREAIWWGLQCASKAAGATPPPPVLTALQVCEKWVANPSEDYRRPAMPAAEAATLATPAGCVAAAVAFIGGSLGPATAPRIPPGENSPALAVAGAVMLTAVADPPKLDEAYVTLINMGIDVANGTNHWK